MAQVKHSHNQEQTRSTTTCSGCTSVRSMVKSVPHKCLRHAECVNKNSIMWDPDNCASCTELLAILANPKSPTILQEQARTCLLHIFRGMRASAMKKNLQGFMDFSTHSSHCYGKTWAGKFATTDFSCRNPPVSAHKTSSEIIERPHTAADWSDEVRSLPAMATASTARQIMGNDGENLNESMQSAVLENNLNSGAGPSKEAVRDIPKQSCHLSGKQRHCLSGKKDVPLERRQPSPTRNRRSPSRHKSSRHRRRSPPRERHHRYYSRSRSSCRTDDSVSPIRHTRDYSSRRYYRESDYNQRSRHNNEVYQDRVGYSTPEKSPVIQTTDRRGNIRTSEDSDGDSSVIPPGQGEPMRDLECDSNTEEELIEESIHGIESASQHFGEPREGLQYFWLPNSVHFEPDGSATIHNWGPISGGEFHLALVRQRKAIAFLKQGIAAVRCIPLLREAKLLVKRPETQKERVRTMSSVLRFIEGPERSFKVQESANGTYLETTPNEFTTALSKRVRSSEAYGLEKKCIATSTPYPITVK